MRDLSVMLWQGGCNQMLFLRQSWLFLLCIIWKCPISVFSLHFFFLLFPGNNNYTTGKHGCQMEWFLPYRFGHSSSLSPFDLLDYCAPHAAVKTVHPCSFPLLSPAACYTWHALSRFLAFTVCLRLHSAFSVCQNIMWLVVCTQTWISCGISWHHIADNERFSLEHQTISVSKKFSILPPTKPWHRHRAPSHQPKTCENPWKHKSCVRSDRLFLVPW